MASTLMRPIPVPFIALLILTSPGLLLGQGVNVFQVQNLTLVANEVYHTRISVQPYALHEIVSEISPSLAPTHEALVTVDLSSEWGLAGLEILHRSDRARSVSTWTPRVAEYDLNITNKGYLDVVYVNVTITQTGAPTITLVPFEDMMAGAIVPLALSFAIPPAVFAVIILLYKRTRLSSQG